MVQRAHLHVGLALGMLQSALLNLGIKLEQSDWQLPERQRTGSLGLFLPQRRYHVTTEMPIRCGVWGKFRSHFR